jgi:hypothetical protein
LANEHLKKKDAVAVAVAVVVVVVVTVKIQFINGSRLLMII